MKDKIQVLQETHDLLVDAGKTNWVCPRPDAVKAKGKGVLKTNLLSPFSIKAASASGSSTTGGDSVLGMPETAPGITAPSSHLVTPEFLPQTIVKQDQLIDWMVALLEEHVIRVVSQGHRQVSSLDWTYSLHGGSLALDEVADVIQFLHRRSREHRGTRHHHEVHIDSEVHAQLG